MPASRAFGPVPQEARQGRHRQRYGEAGERLVAGCIPVRFNGQEGADGVEVLMITSRRGSDAKGWVFPKGGWEDDETVDAAARRETVEEAGVRGELEEPMLGAFAFHSVKKQAAQRRSLDAASPSPAPPNLASVSSGTAIAMTAAASLEAAQPPASPVPAAPAASRGEAAAPDGSPVPAVAPDARGAASTASTSGRDGTPAPAAGGGNSSNGGGSSVCIAHIYVMHVVEELATWPEEKDRWRAWVPLAQASAKCRYPWMREALAAWFERKGWRHLIAACADSGPASHPLASMDSGGLTPAAPAR